MLRRKIVAAALFAALAAPQVSARCWTDNEVSAARIRDLQTAMMVGALQCRGSANEVLPAFNRFVIAARGAIAAENALIRAHFLAERGARAGPAAYDQFITALANGHSQRTGQAGFCATMAATAVEAASASGSLEALSRIAERFDQPRGVDDTCTVAAAPAPYSRPPVTTTITTTVVTVTAGRPAAPASASAQAGIKGSPGSAEQIAQSGLRDR